MTGSESYDFHFEFALDMTWKKRIASRESQIIHRMMPFVLNIFPVIVRD
jgi:hypothetical protein